METAFDPATFLNDNQAAILQLQDLFGQDELDLGGGGAGGGDPSLYYDELTFVPDHTSTMVDTIEPSHLINQNYVDNIMNTIMTEAPLSKRRRSSTCSSSSSLSSYSSSSSSSEEDDDGDEETFSSLTSRRSSLSSDSEEEQEEIITPFMHRRQMEEMILDKITNQLDAEKLPGILTIISKQQQEEEEEVEIDLARLDRDQLTRILSYIDACLKERQGGPKVKLSNYTLKPKPAAPALPVEKPQPSLPKKQPQTKNRSKNSRNRRKSIVETGHIVRGSSHSQLSASHGPISMSALTEMEASSKKKQASNNNKRKKRAAKKRKSQDDLAVQMSSKDHAFKDSIASTKPKRKSAVHKRKLLEEMLQPSSDSEDDDDDLDGTADGGSGIIIFGNEQMDLAVTHNETIVHQERRLSIIQRSTSKPVEQSKPIAVEEEDDDDDDELIDIMM